MELVLLDQIIQKGIAFFLGLFILLLLLLFGWLGKVVFQYLLFCRRLKERLKKSEYILLQVKLPRREEETEDAATMESILAGIHELLFPSEKMLRFGIQNYLSLEIVSLNRHIYFYFVVPKKLRSAIEGQIYAGYPEAEIQEKKDYVEATVNLKPAFCELKLAKTEVYPFKTYPQFKTDPLSKIGGILSKTGSGDQVWIQLVLQPESSRWWLRGWPTLRYVLFGRRTPETKEAQKSSRLAQEKLENPVFRGKIRLAYWAKSNLEAETKLTNLLTTFKQFKGINGLKKPWLFLERGIFLDAYRARRFFGKGSLFGVKEIATIFHLPSSKTKISHIARVISKKAGAPDNLPLKGRVPEEEVSFFAETTFRNERRIFGIKKDDRRRHLYVIGKTGMGKSKLLQLLTLSDIKQGRGMCLLDPHGDVAEEILKYIPQHRIYDVVYFNPADAGYPIGFNPLEGVGSFEFKQNIVAGFIAIFKKLFAWNWNQRLEHILRYTTLALLDYPGATVLGITRMLTDNIFRQQVIAKIEDPLVKKFWTTEFASWNEAFANEAIVPIINKVGQFVASPIIRNIVGQSKGTLDLEEIMNREKILIANLSIGKLGEENSALLGAMLITKLWQTAMARATIPEKERKDFFLYVDEFQNFATSAFANILSEARKYRLSLTVAHQYMGQLPEKVKSTIFGNVGTIVSFRVGGEDAAILEKEFSPVFTAEDLMNLNLREIYVKMLIDGQTTPPFSARTITFPQPDEDYSQEVIEISRRKWARPKKEVEKELGRWTQTETAGAEKEKTPQKSKFSEPLV